MALRRYILGLSLVALTANASTYLRQGCNLVPSEKGREFTLVHSNGKRETEKLSHEDALKYANDAAKDFGIGSNKDVTFDPALAKADISGGGAAQTTRTTRATRARRAPAAVANRTAVVDSTEGGIE